MADETETTVEGETSMQKINNELGHWNGLQPLDEIEGFLVRPGFYNKEGACLAQNGVSFTIHSFGATSCTLLLFRPHESEPYARLRYPESYHIGNTFSMFVFGLRMDEFEYAFQLDGEYNPAKGKLFHKDNVLLDPYAKAVTGQRHWGEKPEGGKDFVYHARVVQNSFDWGNTRQLETPFEDLIIYEMHVRGFTKDASSGVTAPGTYEGLRQKIPYLRDLGVNAVELMPIFAALEQGPCTPRRQSAFWWGRCGQADKHRCLWKARDGIRVGRLGEGSRFPLERLPFPNTSMQFKGDRR